MIDYNLELIKKGAQAKESKLIIQRNSEIISFIKQFINYGHISYNTSYGVVPAIRIQL